MGFGQGAGGVRPLVCRKYIMFWVGLQVDRAHNVAGNARKPHQAKYCVRENKENAENQIRTKLQNSEFKDSETDFEVKSTFGGTYDG